MGEKPGTPREELKIPNPVPDEKAPPQEEVLASLDPTIEEGQSDDYEMFSRMQKRLEEINKEKEEFQKESGIGSLMLKRLTREARQKKSEFLLAKGRGLIEEEEELDLNDQEKFLIDLYDRERQITIDYNEEKDTWYQDKKEK